MAPRLIPPQPEFRSGAEERVWKRLKADLGPDCFLAANVHLHSHQDYYEADLVVGIPDVGFAVIEVKGGPVLHSDEGWIQVTPHGEKPVDPVGQADRAKRLLDSYVRGAVGVTARSASSTSSRSPTCPLARSRRHPTWHAGRSLRRTTWRMRPAACGTR